VLRDYKSVSGVVKAVTNLKLDLLRDYKFLEKHSVFDLKRGSEYHSGSRGKSNQGQRVKILEILQELASRGGWMDTV